MIVGLVSDSHGKAERLKAALEVFAGHGVHAVVHCGDIGSVECVELLATAGVPAYAVAGNMDAHVDELEAAARRCGVIFSRRFVEVPLGATKLLAATHGDDRALLAELIGCGKYLYVCHGHTHRPRDKRRGGVHVVNPGALRHPVVPWRPTVAIIDTQTDTAAQVRLR